MRSCRPAHKNRRNLLRPPPTKGSRSTSRPLDQVATSPCSLRVPDTIPQSPTNAAEATTNGSLAYVPLSAPCKFKLFLKQTYSPYTFASAGFQATLAQATGRGPHYGGGMQGWAKRFGATFADTESRRFIQTFALSTILHEDPRYFPSRKRTFYFPGMVFSNQGGGYQE